jgi:hypothetical protein
MKQRIETRRMLLFLPLLIIPLLAIAFYALGGGKKSAAADQSKQAGINTTLPDAQFTRDTLTDKMSVYDQLKKSGKDTSASEIEAVAGRLGFNGLPEDPQAKAIADKLAALNIEMAKPDEPRATGVVTSRNNVADPAIQKDVARLEMLMKSMQSGSGEDAEMKQLSAMLQSIQEIQNPDLAKLKYKNAMPTAVPDSQFKAIPAVIEGDQKAVQGAVVKLRLLDSLVVGGQVIPKGHLIFGLAAFSNQRLNLEIKNIRLGNSIVPVNLTVFDMRDAMSGINAPEAVLTDAVNDGVVDAAGSIGITGFDLTTQIAGAGIDAARSLLTKKLKRIKQPLKSGYPLLLRDNTKKQIIH